MKVRCKKVFVIEKVKNIKFYKTWAQYRRVTFPSFGAACVNSETKNQDRLVAAKEAWNARQEEVNELKEQIKELQKLNLLSTAAILKLQPSLSKTISIIKIPKNNKIFKNKGKKKNKKKKQK